MPPPTPGLVTASRPRHSISPSKTQPRHHHGPSGPRPDLCGPPFVRRTGPGHGQAPHLLPRGGLRRAGRVTLTTAIPCPLPSPMRPSPPLFFILPKARHKSCCIADCLFDDLDAAKRRLPRRRDEVSVEGLSWPQCLCIFSNHPLVSFGTPKDESFTAAETLALTDCNVSHKTGPGRRRPPHPVPPGPPPVHRRGRRAPHRLHRLRGRAHSEEPSESSCLYPFPPTQYVTLVDCDVTHSPHAAA